MEAKLEFGTYGAFNMHIHATSRAIDAGAGVGVAKCTYLQVSSYKVRQSYSMPS